MYSQAFVLLIPLLGLVSCTSGIKSPRFTLEQLIGQRVVHDQRGTGTIRLHTGKPVRALFAPATVGRKKGWLQIDTGAPLTLLVADVCDAHGFIETSQGHAFTPAGDRMELAVGTIHSMQLDGVEILGPVVLRQEDPSYFRSLAKPPGGGPVMGLLGLDTLRLLNAEIDVGRRVIRLGNGKTSIR